VPDNARRLRIRLERLLGHLVPVDGSGASEPASPKRNAGHIVEPVARCMASGNIRRAPVRIRISLRICSA
jgi:hypothetical protein